MFKKVMAKRFLRKRIQNCNLEYARQIIINLFRGKVIKKELAERLDHFIDNPCEDTALELLKHNPDLVAAFLLARKEGYSTFLYEQGDITFKKDKEKGPMV
jgi:hypothetical protein